MTSWPPTLFPQHHPIQYARPPQIKWGADYLMASHVKDYEYMGSMGNSTEG